MKVNIKFYEKSGFTFSSKSGIHYHGLQEEPDSSFFLCKELIPGYLSGVAGEYSQPQGYFVNEEEAEEMGKRLLILGSIFIAAFAIWTSCALGNTDTYRTGESKNRKYNY